MMYFLKRSIANDFKLVDDCEVTSHEYGKLRLYWPMSGIDKK